MFKPPEIGSPLRNRNGMSYSLTDEFIVTLRIFYDDDFAQKFSSESEARYIFFEIKRFF